MLREQFNINNADTVITVLRFTHLISLHLEESFFFFNYFQMFVCSDDYIHPAFQVLPLQNCCWWFLMQVQYVSMNSFLLKIHFNQWFRCLI